jgi:hypothetical protein
LGFSVVYQRQIAFGKKYNSVIGKKICRYRLWIIGGNKEGAKKYK